MGHVFQGRYKAILVQKETYLLELARYVVLNPVRARMVRAPGDWPWSSYCAMVGAVAAPDWLETRWILAAFGESDADAVARYARFVAEGGNLRMAAPSASSVPRIRFFRGIDAAQAIPADRDLREVPQAKARQPAQPLAHYARAHPDRNRAIAAAYASGGYTMQDIGDYFGVHYSRVSRIVGAAEKAKRTAKDQT